MDRGQSNGLTQRCVIAFMQIRPVTWSKTSFSIGISFAPTTKSSLSWISLIFISRRLEAAYGSLLIHAKMQKSLMKLTIWTPSTIRTTASVTLPKNGLRQCRGYTFRASSWRKTGRIPLDGLKTPQLSTCLRTESWPSSIQQTVKLTSTQLFGMRSTSALKNRGNSMCQFWIGSPPLSGISKKSRTWRPTTLCSTFSHSILR